MDDTVQMDDNGNVYGFPPTKWSNNDLMKNGQAAQQALYLQRTYADVMDGLLSLNIDNGSKRVGKRRELAFDCWKLICGLETVLRQMGDDDMVVKQFDRFYNMMQRQERWANEG